MSVDQVIKTPQVNKRVIVTEINYSVPIRWALYSLLKHEERLQNAGFAGTVCAEEPG